MDEPTHVRPEIRVLKAAYWAAFNVLGNHDDALEIAQSTVAAFALYEAVIRKPEAWATRVARNAAINLIRDVRSREEPHGLEDVRPGVTPDFADDLVLRVVIRDAVDRLPPKQREAIRARYLEDQSVETVADLLEVSMETAKTHLARARAALRVLIESEGGM
jgi:RNA polymerase sigma factor (sigma-70 family)